MSFLHQLPHPNSNPPSHPAISMESINHFPPHPPWRPFPYGHLPRHKSQSTRRTPSPSIVSSSSPFTPPPPNNRNCKLHIKQQTSRIVHCRSLWVVLSSSMATAYEELSRGLILFILIPSRPSTDIITECYYRKAARILKQGIGFFVFYILRVFVSRWPSHVSHSLYSPISYLFLNRYAMHIPLVKHFCIPAMRFRRARRIHSAHI